MISSAYRNLAVVALQRRLARLSLPMPTVEPTMTNHLRSNASCTALLDSIGCIQSAWIDALATASDAWLALCRDANAHCGELARSALAGRLPDTVTSDRAPILYSDAMKALCNDYLRLLAHLEAHATLLQESVGEATAVIRDRCIAHESIAAMLAPAVVAGIDAATGFADDSGDGVEPTGGQAAGRSSTRRKAA